MALTRKSSITSSKSSLRTSQDEDEAWTCAKCTKIFKESDAQLMECQRCKEHFCITCLKKTKAKYSMLCKTDAMWFCGKCRIVMEQHAVTDIEIERRCKQIMENFEERITSLEKTVDNKCDEDRVPTPNQVPVTTEMPKQKIKEEVVLKHLSALKIDKSPGMDKLHLRLLKEIAESITKPLCIIFSQSLENKTVPNDWKNAMISAIFKKGNKSLAKNYRPVSLTSVVCKIMEKMMREFIIEHMKTNNLFSKKQYGFIAGRTTGLQLLEVMISGQRH
ncbi:unnamed protein product [Mytilus coruscus]|uniref:Uncharacterized protein n=1 Tax=Mytilus coruscus TaxID=42192 RepID=A0A6J8CXI7_MYTCO|nr:unnamed protein product [Mytilus coruscus]